MINQENGGLSNEQIIDFESGTLSLQIDHSIHFWRMLRAT